MALSQPRTSGSGTHSSHIFHYPLHTRCEISLGGFMPPSLQDLEMTSWKIQYPCNDLLQPEGIQPLVDSVSPLLWLQSQDHGIIIRGSSIQATAMQLEPLQSGFGCGMMENFRQQGRLAVRQTSQVFKEITDIDKREWHAYDGQRWRRRREEDE